MRVFHLIALIFGAITTLCCILAVSGVNGGWLDAGFDCGTLKCCSGGNCATWDEISRNTVGIFGRVCEDMGTGGKVTLALCVISMVLSLGATVIVLLRFLGMLNSRGLSILAAVLFIVVMVLLIVAEGVYLGFFLGSCCTSGCNANGKYALIFDNIGIVTAIVTFILLFIRAGEGDK